MKTCTHCNLNFPDDKSFCNDCGRALDEKAIESPEAHGYLPLMKELRFFTMVVSLYAFRSFALLLLQHYIIYPMYHSQNMEMGQKTDRISYVILTMLIVTVAVVASILSKRTTSRIVFAMLVAVELFVMFFYNLINFF